MGIAPELCRRDGLDSLGGFVDSGESGGQGSGACLDSRSNVGNAFSVERSPLQCADVQRTWETIECVLAVSQYGVYPHTGDGEVRRVFHKIRSRTIENFNEVFQEHLRLWVVYNTVEKKCQFTV
jgi:hypothetical protein